MPVARTRVLIDGGCGLCSALARFVATRDGAGQFEFAGGDDLSSVVLVEPGGAVFTQSTAVLRILLRLGAPWSWLGHAGLLVPSALRDAVYRFVARHRRRLSCPRP